MFNIAILGLGDFENWNNSQSLSLGGASGVIKSILPYLDADSIYLMGITSNKKNLYEKIPLTKNISIVPIAYVPRNTILPIRFYAFFYGRKINSVIRNYNIHSVYSHAEEISYWIKPGMRILYHMHGSTNALVKAKKRIFRTKLLREQWESIRRANIKKAKHIIAIDHLCMNLIRRHGMEDKAVLLPNFVDTSVFYKDTAGCSLVEHIDKKILLFVGRIEEVKGLELFVDTLLEMNRRETGKWNGVIVGRGTYEPILKKYISDASAESLFYFTGPVFEQDKLRGIYNKASILMIPSFYEGIPMVILESLACGTPVISTDVGGVKDLIADGVLCHVNDRRDPIEFADLIEFALKKKDASTDEFRFSSLKASYLINNILRGGEFEKKNY
jgi:glycosyltransferase involved in cell wall biosynthesis